MKKSQDLTSVTPGPNQTPILDINIDSPTPEKSHLGFLGSYYSVYGKVFRIIKKPTAQYFNIQRRNKFYWQEILITTAFNEAEKFLELYGAFLKHQNNSSIIDIISYLDSNIICESRDLIKALKIFM